MKTKKIDLFFEGKYIGSTNSSKTCKEAKQKYLELREKSQYRHIYAHILASPEKLKAFFSK